MIIASRRRLLGIGAAFLAAPAIVRVSNLMPISVLAPCRSGEMWLGEFSGVTETFAWGFEPGSEVWIGGERFIVGEGRDA